MAKWLLQLVRTFRRRHRLGDLPKLMKEVFEEVREDMPGLYEANKQFFDLLQRYSDDIAFTIWNVWLSQTKGGYRSFEFCWPDQRWRGMVCVKIRTFRPRESEKVTIEGIDVDRYIGKPIGMYTAMLGKPDEKELLDELDAFEEFAELFRI